MQVQFNKPVTIGAHTYGKGQHEVAADDVKNNWFFDALVEEGSAVVLRAEDAPVETTEEQAEVPAAEGQVEETPAEAPAKSSKNKTKAGAKETGDA